MQSIHRPKAEYRWFGFCRYAHSKEGEIGITSSFFCVCLFLMVKTRTSFLILRLFTSLPFLLGFRSSPDRYFSKSALYPISHFQNCNSTSLYCSAMSSLWLQPYPKVRRGILSWCSVKTRLFTHRTPQAIWACMSWVTKGRKRDIMGLFSQTICLIWSLSLSSGLLLSQILLTPWCNKAILSVRTLPEEVCYQLLGNKSPLLLPFYSSPSSVRLSSSHLSWNWMMGFRSLQSFTRMYNYLLPLPMDGVVLKATVLINFWFTLDATDWKYVVGVYACGRMDGGLIFTLQEWQIVLLTLILIGCSVHWQGRKGKQAFQLLEFH